MTDATIASPALVRARILRWVVGVAAWSFFLGNAGAIVWIWIANHNMDFSFAPDMTATVTARVGGLTGLLAAYLALIQLLLLARLPWLERLAGFDRLTVWHRWNGFVCLALVVAHTVLAIFGRSIDARHSFFHEFWSLLADNTQVGMVTATISLALFVLVTVTSITIARRKLRYELWYAVHFTAYAAVALAWFHEIPTGGDINGAFHPDVQTYWQILFFGTLALLLFRVASPLANVLRFRLRVAEVTAEGPTVTSIRMTGRRLDTLKARPGQFMLWRFLTKGYWSTSHPFSLSAAPDGRSLRISVKAAGDHTAQMRSIRPGTRVVAEGPYGTFTEVARHRPKILLIAGGIGITPIRSLAETMDGDVILIHRVLNDADVVFRSELEELASRRSLSIHTIVGDHRDEESRHLLSTSHLRELVPDIAERDVYVCGPPGMVTWMLKNIRGAGVSRRRLHVERFAL
ncbi:MAG TPA: ferredoxin reductase family protein [Gaiellaceae bacterium]